MNNFVLVNNEASHYFIYSGLHRVITLAYIFCHFERLIEFTLKHYTIIQTGITCNKISCYISCLQVDHC